MASKNRRKGSAPALQPIEAQIQRLTDRAAILGRKITCLGERLAGPADEAARLALSEANTKLNAETVSIRLEGLEKMLNHVLATVEISQRYIG